MFSFPPLSVGDARVDREVSASCLSNPCSLSTSSSLAPAPTPCPHLSKMTNSSRKKGTRGNEPHTRCPRLGGTTEVDREVEQLLREQLRRRQYKHKLETAKSILESVNIETSVVDRVLDIRERAWMCSQQQNFTLGNSGGYFVLPDGRRISSLEELAFRNWLQFEAGGSGYMLKSGGPFSNEVSVWRTAPMFTEKDQEVSAVGPVPFESMMLSQHQHSREGEGGGTTGRGGEDHLVHTDVLSSSTTSSASASCAPGGNSQGGAGKDTSTTAPVDGKKMKNNTMIIGGWKFSGGNPVNPVFWSKSSAQGDGEQGLHSCTSTSASSTASSPLRTFTLTGEFVENMLHLIAFSACVRLAADLANEETWGFPEAALRERALQRDQSRMKTSSVEGALDYWSSSEGGVGGEPEQEEEDEQETGEQAASYTNNMFIAHTSNGGQEVQVDLPVDVPLVKDDGGGKNANKSWVLWALGSEQVDVGALARNVLGRGGAGGVGEREDREEEGSAKMNVVVGDFRVAGAAAVPPPSSSSPLSRQQTPPTQDTSMLGVIAPTSGTAVQPITSSSASGVKAKAMQQEQLHQHEQVMSPTTNASLSSTRASSPNTGDCSAAPDHFVGGYNISCGVRGGPLGMPYPRVAEDARLDLDVDGGSPTTACRVAGQEDPSKVKEERAHDENDNDNDVLDVLDSSWVEVDDEMVVVESRGEDEDF